MPMYSLHSNNFTDIYGSVIHQRDYLESGKLFDVTSPYKPCISVKQQLDYLESRMKKINKVVLSDTFIYTVIRLLRIMNIPPETSSNIEMSTRHKA